MSVCIDFLLCKSDSSVPVILFISKMFHVDPSALPEKRTQSELLKPHPLIILLYFYYVGLLVLKK